MKKITAELGANHSEFEKQLKELLNEMSDVIVSLLDARQECSQLCQVCLKRADFVTENMNDGSNSAYCQKCLSK